MNNYEKKNLERILGEIKEIEEKEPNMSDEKKAYYLYHSLGDIYKYKTDFLLTDADMEYERKVALYNEGTLENGEAICTDMNLTFFEGLKKIGIEAQIVYEYDKYREENFSHADVVFKVNNGKYYIANLVPDVMHIKTGMKTRNFGINLDDMKRKPMDNKGKYLPKLKNIIEGKDFTKISEEELRKWDNEFGFTYKGLYTNEVIDLLEKETSNEDFMMRFFKTQDKEELMQKKFEFLMNNIGIININTNKQIGEEEAAQYYQKIITKMFSSKEMDKIELLNCYEEKEERKQLRSLIILKKKEEILYYLYNKNEYKYDNISKEELINIPIKHMYRNMFDEKIENTKNIIQRYEETLKNSNEER